ncbi:putative Mce family protein [Nocardia neocaledoniensis NBRC 108232]|uniref:Phospholipid/cholesterol/gamma-HCH transport system substrate-binding protein n=1 Tax=Nocardia neocaledoniensis TaxID=236511 RepID=A0A317N7L1_9NOCA|nr:MlaD family protein [Nocardia neocaledoniensis]PWV71044.1 phospholipid/cholesterol/gamma-HCH transport system substrate-binding protein [Nocardia neocaledoniensis]GEM30289.1 putative Mce family protein [Nocardia neocaledoniensis NBRC 108232]
MSRLSRTIAGMRSVVTSRDEAAVRRTELWAGLAGIVVLIGALLAVAALYAVPFGKRTYTALLPEAQAVRVGDDVRLAGVPVGAVTGLELTDTSVEMTFTVDGDVFVGAQTSLDIRMLTIVGGHYVALVPAGTDPLGQTPIPTDRVRLPYNLSQTFQDAVEPLRAIDGDQLRANLEALSGSITASPEGIRETVAGIGQFVAALDSQRVEVSKAIAIADEQLGAVEQARGELGRLVEKISLLETMLADKQSEVRVAVEQLDRVVSRLAGVQPSWESTLRPMAVKLADAVPELIALGDRLQPVIDGVHELAQRLSALVPPSGGVSVDQSGTTLGPDSAVCVPVAGRVC